MFEPDYRNILDSAFNKEARRLPLYEHNVSFEKIGEIKGVSAQEVLAQGCRNAAALFGIAL